ncbi:recombinase family protein [Streptomyces monashensis]|uniref:recombinase family protein n=1 Tax=Streptomyces monashensis TaxID=1678012 RepID=UPI0033D87FB2
MGPGGGPSRGCLSSNGSDPPYGRGDRWRTWSSTGSRPISSRRPGRTSSWTRPASRTRSSSRSPTGTSSRLHPLQRPKFGELLAYARPGDTVHISEFRLVRGTRHILDVLDVLHRARLALRKHDGAFSAMDLTTRRPRTGELLSTVKFMVQTPAAAGELQRDLPRELTYDGLRAAEAKGNKGGRRVHPARARPGEDGQHRGAVVVIAHRARAHPGLAQPGTDVPAGRRAWSRLNCW